MVYSRRIPGTVTGVHEVLRHVLMFSYSPASRKRPVFDSRPVYVEFLVEKVAVVLKVFQFSRVNIIPSLRCNH